MGDVADRVHEDGLVVDVDQQIVVDLRGVEFLDSALVAHLRNDAERGGYRLELVRGPGCVQRVFELTATSGLFDWRDQGVWER